ncbi:hypothetical protein BDV96DRAFT_565933 [Lophiotrema nucula]|uniref:C2H2-type domain-containing protein n=1 Tax=Lophiotrema nucula TaxID=690887 RepID=A0A6A5ZRP6_9PLEO|nr:hypothetical protein BDV96DRAFT_565933 [Lophiotrema nucula]
MAPPSIKNFFKPTGSARSSVRGQEEQVAGSQVSRNPSSASTAKPRGRPRGSKNKKDHGSMDRFVSVAARRSRSPARHEGNSTSFRSREEPGFQRRPTSARIARGKLPSVESSLPDPMAIEPTFKSASDGTLAGVAIANRSSKVDQATPSSSDRQDSTEDEIQQSDDEFIGEPAPTDAEESSEDEYGGDDFPDDLFDDDLVLGDDDGTMRPPVTSKNVPIEKVSISFRNSDASVRLIEALALFHTGFKGHDHDAWLHDNLISTLLMNETPTDATSHLVPLDSLSLWLNSAERSLKRRLVYILQDMVRASNGDLPDSGVFPFEDMPDITKRAIFLYAPTTVHFVTVEASYKRRNVNNKYVNIGQISVFDPMNAIGKGGKSCEVAKEELVPLLTLGKLSLKSQFANVQWKTENVSPAACPRQSRDNIDCGPISILVAIYQANGRALPTSGGTEQERYAFGQKIRLACAKRLLQFVLEKRGSGFDEKSLFQLLKDLLKQKLNHAPRVSGSGSGTISKGVQKSSSSAQSKPVSRVASAANVGLKPSAREVSKTFDPFESRSPVQVGNSDHATDDTDSDGILESTSRQLPLLPLEKTGAVPCPHNCGKKYKSYERANSHGMLFCEKRDNNALLPCPWKRFNGCNETFTSRTQLASHGKKHMYDPRTPHMCRRPGCTKRSPNYYWLVSHELNCGKPPRWGPTRQLRYRILLDPGKAKPSIIVVARSSNDLPKSWLAGQKTPEKGLPRWIAPQLEEYRRIHNDRRPAVLHAGIRNKTRYLPAPEAREGFIGVNEKTQVRHDKENSFQFTAEIVKDILAADEPTVPTIGADGWACDTDRIGAFLPRAPRFSLVVRFNFIEDQSVVMSPEHLTKSDKVWWGVYDSRVISDALVGLRTDDAPVNDLVALWMSIQGKKDIMSKHHLIPGRNSGVNNELHSDYEYEYESDD